MHFLFTIVRFAGRAVREGAFPQTERGKAFFVRTHPRLSGCAAKCVGKVRKREGGAQKNRGYKKGIKNENEKICSG